MRLLMVARRYPPDVRSGTETVFENLYKRARRRHEVQLVVGYRQSRELVPPEAVAVDLREGRKHELWWRMARATLEAERRFRPDVVLANSIEALSLRTPMACIVHDLNFGQAERSGGSVAREWFYRLRSRGLGAIVTVSEAARGRLVAAGLPADRAHVVHNGVDLQAFHPLTTPRDPSSPEGFTTFAYPSRILPGKGQHLAIDALARMRPDQKARAVLVVVGAVADAHYRDQLKIQAYNQPVELAHDVPEIAPFYQRADVILFPSMMEEGFGFTAVEGMACGKPVIWFDQPAVREATGGLGLAVPRGDVDGLRDAMVHLMDHPEERARLGAEGRAFVEARYDWDGVWERYERVLEGLARGG